MGSSLQCINVLVRFLVLLFLHAWHNIVRRNSVKGNISELKAREFIYFKPRCSSLYTVHWTLIFLYSFRNRFVTFKYFVLFPAKQRYFIINKM
jgi:hypothetical protein